MTTKFAMLETKETRRLAAFQKAALEPSRPAGLPLLWLIPGLVSAGLLWTSFFPLSWGPAAWFALVPLLTLVRLRVGPGWIYSGAYLAGVLFFVTALQWMRVADDHMYIAWILLAMYCALYFPAGIFLMRFLDRRTPLPLVLSVPMVWTALEFVRSFLLTGFPWYILGYSQHANLPLIQIADLAGVYGVSFVLAAVNAWLFECIWRSVSVRQFLRVKEPAARSGMMPLACQGLGLAGLLAGCLLYGRWQLARTEYTDGPILAMLQGDFEQRIRMEAVGNIEKSMDMMVSYKALCGQATWRKMPDLIVWPETAFPYLWLKLPVDLNRVSDSEMKWTRDQRELMQSLVPTNQLVGTECDVLDEHGERQRFNSAVLVPQGNHDEERYDKVHRVPFGEYVPLRESLPFMKYLAPYGQEWAGIGVGEHMTRFTLGQYRFGVLICNEDSDPVLGRSYGSESSDGPAVDFLINISNDGWFADTCEHEQHLAICRFRAIECRRAVARAVNTGISAIIDGNGRVQKPERLFAESGKPHEGPEFWEIEPKNGVVADLPENEWHRYKNVEGVLRGTVPIDHRSSLYVRWGDWLPWGCCLVIALGFAQMFLVRALARPEAG